mgnify:CR=1 FL=1
MLSGSCGKDKDIGFDDRLTFKNNSADSIYYYWNFNHPDTTVKGGSGTVVAPGESKKYSIPGNWEDRINSISSKTLIVFIISVDTLNKYSFEKIAADYNILRRHDLTVDKLKAMNWTVTYP